MMMMMLKRIHGGKIGLTCNMNNNKNKKKGRKRKLEKERYNSFS
jgi:hypothetical protein